MKKEYQFLLIGIFGGLIIAIIFSKLIPQSSFYGMMGSYNFANSTSNGSSSSQIDAHFIEQMIPHHQDAVTMSELAFVKSTHPEIKTLAKNIIEAQTKEIISMKSWYQDWFGQVVPANTQTMNIHGMNPQTNSIHMGMMGNDTDIQDLTNSSNFDKTFIEQMIPHHQMAIMMANMLKVSTSRPEMKKLAEDIISSQTKEISQMRQMYTDWGF